MNKIVLIDNYDSFSYNLFQQVVTTCPHLAENLTVVRNDQVTCEDLFATKPIALIVSPGPGGPQSAGISVQAAKMALKEKIPYLGVCLGHQVLAEVCGATITRAQPVHGHTSLIHHESDVIFKGLPSPFEAMRYHSLTVEYQSLPDSLAPIAWTDQGKHLMGIHVIGKPAWGVQFHPESFLSPWGSQIVKNFFEYQNDFISSHNTA